MDYYNEQNSMPLGFETGSRAFDLRRMPGLARGARIRRVRIDTDAGSVCTRYEQTRRPFNDTWERMAQRCIDGVDAQQHSMNGYIGC